MDEVERRGGEGTQPPDDCRHRLRFTGLPGAAYRCRNDQNWSVEYVGDDIRRITGFTPDDFTSGRVHWPQLIVPEDADCVARVVNEAASAGQPFQFAYRVCHKDGSERWVWEQGHGVVNGGNEVTRFEGFVTDITDQVRAQEDLAAAQQRLQAHTDNSPLAVIEFDPQWRVVRWSNGAERLFGWSAAEVIGRAFTELRWVHEDDIESVAGLAAEVLAGTRPSSVHTNRNYRTDGSVLHCEWHNSAIYDGAGRLTSVLAQVLDITQRKLAEDALRERTQRYELIAMASCDAIWDWDVPNRRVFFSPRWKELRGFTMDEVGDSEEEWSSSIHPEDAQRVMAAVQAHFEGRTAVFAEEYRIRCKDGSWKWILDRGVALRDASGRVIRMAGSESDITERRQTEERLRLQLRLTHAIADCAGDSIFVLDAKGRVTFANAMAATVFGYTHDELMGQVLHDRLHHHYPDGRPYPFEECPNCQVHISGDTVRSHEAVFLRKDDTQVPVACSNSVLEVAGEDMGVVLVVHDITSLKRAEAALREADRRKNEFLAVLAHELRNPLAPIRNAVSILKLKGTADPGLQAAQDMIERQLQHMVRLIDDLLEVSRITRGKLQLRRERVELAAILEHALEASRPHIERAAHRLDVRLPAEAIYLDADPVRLTQVFLNVLNNACKYTDKGGHIGLRVERDGAEVVVRVKDSGIGIPAEHLPHLFEMFSQVDSALERSEGGLGIGLSLARGLVEMHGGRIEAFSEGPGHGSEFSVHLPTLSQPAPAGVAGREGVRAAGAQRVLVVDDNRDSAESLAMLLRLTGYEVETAHDGVEAVEAAACYWPDVVLLDLGMPRLDGYAACRRIREQPWGREMAIIAMTGWGQEEDRRKTTEAGFDGHLVKPVDSSELLRLLAERRAARG